MSATATATSLRSSSLMAVLLLASLFVTLGAAKSAKESPPSACADELVRFSPCLSYVASPPNNLSDSPASKCCDAFSSAAESGRAVCLCYLVQDPPMLGFPVTVARVLSLSSVCRRRNSTAASTSLQSLCSESPELPPLRNTTISVISGPPPSGHETASSPSPKPTNKSSTRPSFSTPPSSAIEPARVSSAAAMKRIFKNNTSWFLPAISIFILI
ncbi:non-specific lipid transfer protein GPI-anchored 25-like [Rosa sericea]